MIFNRLSCVLKKAIYQATKYQALVIPYYSVYKVRIQSTDQAKGKRGGYRMLYYLRTSRFIALLRIYPKSARSDLPAEVIRRIIEDYEQQSS